MSKKRTPTRRIAIVVQRYHKEIAAGAETHARTLVQILSPYFTIDVLTTQALRSDTWENELPPFEQEQDHQVLRFPVDLQRSAEWKRLHSRLVETHRVLARGSDDPRIYWPVQLQDYWVMHQGPHSSELLHYIATNASKYDRFIFLTYLYSPTYFGLGIVPRNKSILVPTLHDETPAYLSQFALQMSGAGEILWNTQAEREMGKRIWGIDRGHVLGAPVEPCRQKSDSVADDLIRKFNLSYRSYYLYMGRNDPAKGIDSVLEAFSYLDRSKHSEAGKSTLVLAGDHFRLPRGITNAFSAGYLSEEDKCLVLRGARMLIIPSVNESLSLVTLEAMANGIEVAGRKESRAVSEHINQSQFGHLWSTVDELVSIVLDDLARHSGPAVNEAKRGMDYVEKKYSSQVIQKRLLAIMNDSAIDAL